MTTRLEDESGEEVTAEMNLVRDGKEVKIVITGPSHLEIARAMHHIGSPKFLQGYINGVNEDEGWEE